MDEKGKRWQERTIKGDARVALNFLAADVDGIVDASAYDTHHHACMEVTRYRNRRRIKQTTYSEWTNCRGGSQWEGRGERVMRRARRATIPSAPRWPTPMAPCSDHLSPRRTNRYVGEFERFTRSQGNATNRYVAGDDKRVGRGRVEVDERPDATLLARASDEVDLLIHHLLWR